MSVLSRITLQPTLSVTLSPLSTSEGELSIFSSSLDNSCCDVITIFSVHLHENRSQYKVTEGDVIVTNRILGPDVGTKIILDKVLLVGSKEFTAIGTPLLDHAGVHAVIEEHTRSEKVIISYFTSSITSIVRSSDLISLFFK